MLSGGFRNFSQGVTQSNKKKNLYIDDNLGIFPKVLHNLIKRKIYILMTITKKKKNTQIHKVLQHKTCGVQLWLLLVLLNRDERR